MDAPRPGVLNEEELAEALRREGLRLTRPRRAVYAVLRERGGHLSADQVLAALAEGDSRVSRMTVYNALADLHGAGVVLQADAGPGRALWEARGDWHHHFVCRRCGSVADVPCAVGEKPCLDLPRRLGRADEAQVIFRGLCRPCLRKGRSRGAAR